MFPHRHIIEEEDDDMEFNQKEKVIAHILQLYGDFWMNRSKIRPYQRFHLYDLFLVETSSATPSRNLSKAEKAHIKQVVKNEEKKARRAEIRRTNPYAKSCSACGSWDHERSNNKDCPHYIPKR
jgi:hypothetical protein